MKEALHTRSSRTRSLRLVPEFGLVDVSAPGLSEPLAAKVREQLELMAGRKGKHDRNRAAYRGFTQ
jgi:hypothetical protein